MTMDNERNYANIARRVIDQDDDGQNIQQFMSDSPWSTNPVFGQIQTEINHRPQLNGGMLTLDALVVQVAETKLDWSHEYPRDPLLADELGVVEFHLSMSNVREMLKAVMPLKQLSPQEATQLVIKHLVNRSHSTSCRLKAQRRVYNQNNDT